MPFLLYMLSFLFDNSEWSSHSCSPNTRQNIIKNNILYVKQIVDAASPQSIVLYQIKRYLKCISFRHLSFSDLPSIRRSSAPFPIFRFAVSCFSASINFFDISLTLTNATSAHRSTTWASAATPPAFAI